MSTPPNWQYFFRKAAATSSMTRCRRSSRLPKQRVADLNPRDQAPRLNPHDQVLRPARARPSNRAPRGRLLPEGSPLPAGLESRIRTRPMNARRASLETASHAAHRGSLDRVAHAAAGRTVARGPAPRSSHRSRPTVHRVRSG
jgi:hypothetical protein